MTLDKRNQMIGANLRYYRSTRKLSYRKLARLTGIPHSTLALIEKGNSTASLEMLDQIADALGISREYILQEDIAGTLDFLEGFIGSKNPKFLGPVMFWLSKSLQGPLKAKALSVALDNVDRQEPLYRCICFDLAEYYEDTCPEESLQLYKQVAHMLISTNGLYKG